MEKQLESRLAAAHRACLPSEEIQDFIEESEPIAQLWLENSEASGN
jgi:hypothetical protein